MSSNFYGRLAQPAEPGLVQETVSCLQFLPVLLHLKIGVMMISVWCSGGGNEEEDVHTSMLYTMQSVSIFDQR